MYQGLAPTGQSRLISSSLTNYEGSIQYQHRGQQNSKTHPSYCHITSYHIPNNILRIAEIISRVEIKGTQRPHTYCLTQTHCEVKHYQHEIYIELDSPTFTVNPKPYSQEHIRYK